MTEHVGRGLRDYILYVLDGKNSSLLRYSGPFLLVLGGRHKHFAEQFGLELHVDSDEILANLLLEQLQLDVADMGKGQ